jgi:methyl-accepting chemotaxis protein
MRVITLLLAMSVGSVFAAGECKKEEAKKSVEWACTQIEKDGKKGLEAIKNFKYCGQNYVWIQDSPEVRMVLHPIKRKLNHKAHGGRNAKDLKGYKDKKGKAIFIEFDKVAAANAAGGWVDYVWPKPGDEDATPKVSYVKKCAGGLNFVAGSGVWK